MARSRMSWDWVGNHPVFVYTSFIDHFKFKVWVKVAPKNQQNGEQRRVIEPYTQRGFASKNEVVEIALEKARVLLGVPADWKDVAEAEMIVPDETCPHCGASAAKWEDIKHADPCDPFTIYRYDIDEEWEGEDEC